MKVTTIAVIAAVAVIATACAQSVGSLVDDTIDDFAQQAQEGAESAFNDLLEEANEQADSVFDGLLDSGDVLARARQWADVPVLYGMFDEDTSNDRHNEYKTDCSGFVSFVWGLKAPGIGTAQFISGGYAVQLDSVEEMKAGDVFNNNLSLEAGHVVLFLSWIEGSGFTQFQGADLSGTEGRTVIQTFTLAPHSSGVGWNILERPTPGPYFPQRQIGDN